MHLKRMNYFTSEYCCVWVAHFWDVNDMPNDWKLSFYGHHKFAGSYYHIFPNYMPFHSSTYIPYHWISCDRFLTSKLLEHYHDVIMLILDFISYCVAQCNPRQWMGAVEYMYAGACVINSKPPLPSLKAHGQSQMSNSCNWNSGVDLV